MNIMRDVLMTPYNFFLPIKTCLCRQIRPTKKPD